MNKKILLFITGIIPILFLIPAIYYFVKDNRNDLIKSAVFLNEKNFNEIKVGDLVKFDAKISNLNPILKENFSIPVIEKYKKGDGSRKPLWQYSESFTDKIILDLNEKIQFPILLSKEYIPCGDSVKIKEIEFKKSRMLGLSNGLDVSAVGKVVQINPILIDTKMSLCSGSIESFEKYWNKKLISYIFLGICIFLPALGILGIALKKSE